MGAAGEDDLAGVRMDFGRLPESTYDALRRWLSGNSDPVSAAAWAADLLGAGFDADAIVRLAVLDRDDREDVRRLVPIVISEVGFDTGDPYSVAVLLEERILRSFLKGHIDEDYALSAGKELWGCIDHDFQWQYDCIRDELGVIGGGDLSFPETSPPKSNREYARIRLAEEGVFERAGLAAEAGQPLWQQSPPLQD
ncbi:MAG: hypothetical protein ACOY4K_07025 [Pseudomonadota bacterium]